MQNLIESRTCDDSPKELIPYLDQSDVCDFLKKLYQEIETGTVLGLIASSNTAAFTRLSFDLHQPSDWFAHLYDIKICLWFLLLQYSYHRRVHSQSVP